MNICVWLYVGEYMFFSLSKFWCICAYICECVYIHAKVCVCICVCVCKVECACIGLPLSLAFVRESLWLLVNNNTTKRVLRMGSHTWRQYLTRPHPQHECGHCFLSPVCRVVHGVFYVNGRHWNATLYLTLWALDSILDAYATYNFGQ